MLESGKKLTNGFVQCSHRAAFRPWNLAKEKICSLEVFPNRILSSKAQNLDMNKTQLPETVRCMLLSQTCTICSHE